MTEKRLETMTFRLPSDLKLAIESIAEARLLSPSSFVCSVLTEVVARERRLFESYSRVFGEGRCVPGTPEEEMRDV